MATITELKQELDRQGIQYPAKASKADLSAMVEFLADDDDGPAADTMPAMDVSVDTDAADGDAGGDEPDAGMGAARHDSDGEVDMSGLSAADADRLAELFGDAWTDDDEPDDRGTGDLAGEYVEVFDNYHQSTLDQAPDGDLERVVAPTMRRAVQKAQAHGRRIVGLPVIAHNYPATGNDRRQIVVQVSVAPTRRSAARRGRSIR